MCLLSLRAIPSPTDSSREFLTGFHKRKVKRTETAKKNALEREKQERRETRNEVESGIIRYKRRLTIRQQRRALRERAKENASEVEKAYGGTLSTSFHPIESAGSQYKQVKKNGQAFRNQTAFRTMKSITNSKAKNSWQWSLLWRTLTLTLSALPRRRDDPRQRGRTHRRQIPLPTPNGPKTIQKGPQKFGTKQKKHGKRKDLNSVQEE